MPTFDAIDGAEPSTVTFQLATVTQDRGGATQHQEIVTIGGTESTLAVAAVRDAAPASTEWALAVRQVGLSTQALRVAQSTAGDLNVTVAGYVAPSTLITVRQSTVGDFRAAVYQSTAADLNVTVAGYVAPSTTVTVSTVAGVVRIAGNNAADGIVHVGDSTNAALRVNVVAGAAGGSTIVTVNGNQSSNSSAYLPVRLTNGTAFLTPSQDYADGSTASNLAGPVLTFDNGSNATMRTVSLTNGFPVNVVAGAAGGSTLVTIRQSTVGDLRAAVYQSTAADLNVTVAPGLIVRSSAANFLASVYQSTASELQATARINTSSGGAVEGSTASPAHTAIGLHVRQALSSLQSATTFLTSSNSTALYSLVSSVASLRHKVYAYKVASTHTSPSTLIFMSSGGIDLWAVNFGSGSSGITGANLTVSPPGYLFATASQNALNCRIENTSTQVLVRVSISYFTEP